MLRLPLLALLALSAIPALPLTQAAAQEEEKKEEPKKIRRHPDIISYEEIEQRPDFQSAYDAVRKLRSSWLRVRKSGFGDPASIKVYVDGLKMGSLEILQNMPITTVQEMRHMSGTDATTRYGIDHGSGAILVTTHRGVP